MLTIPMIVMFTGYTVGSYGRVLLKGWNISFGSWVNPLNPYQWPSGGPDFIPPGQLFPAAKGVTAAQAAAGGSNSTPPSQAGFKAGVGAGLKRLLQVG